MCFPILIVERRSRPSDGRDWRFGLLVEGHRFRGHDERPPSLFWFQRLALPFCANVRVPSESLS
jgi:hypothetical protein